MIFQRFVGHILQNGNYFIGGKLITPMLTYNKYSPHMILVILNFIVFLIALFYTTNYRFISLNL